MFYVWLFSSSFFAIFFIAQLTLFSFGIIPNLMNIFMTLALEITTASLMIKKLKEPHKHSYSLKAVGLWFLYYGLFLLVSANRVDIPSHLALRIEFSLVLMSLGILIFYYNQIGTETDQKKISNNSESLPRIKSEDKYFDLLCLLHYLTGLKDVKDNPEFYENLVDLIEIIKSVETNSDISCYNKLDNIIELYEEYAHLIEEPVMTLDILKRLAEIEEETKEIKAILKIYYRKALNPEINALDNQINTLDSQLRQNGLVESDFKI